MQRHPLSGGVLFTHYSDVDGQAWHWPNFTPKELACRHCGELYWHTPTFNALQRLRDRRNRPVNCNSCHRCRVWNYAVEGAPRSAHLWMASDIAIGSNDPVELLEDMQAVGFKSFGLYLTFIHGDLRPGRFWYGSLRARAMWERLRAAEKPDLTL